MKRLLLLFPIFLTSCTSSTKLATAHIVLQRGTNRVEVTQPKDTTIGRLELKANGDLLLENYSSTVNAAALAAGNAQTQMFGTLLDLALKAYGVQARTNQ